MENGSGLREPDGGLGPAGTKEAREVRPTKEYIMLYFDDVPLVYAPIPEERANRRRRRLSSRPFAPPPSPPARSLSFLFRREMTVPLVARKSEFMRAIGRARLAADDPSSPPAPCRRRPAGIRLPSFYSSPPLPLPTAFLPPYHTSLSPGP